MEKKNTVLLTVIAVATLLVAVVGATFAYFTATTTPTNNAGNTNVSTSTNVGSVDLKLETIAAANTGDIAYPGGFLVNGAKVTATSTGTTNQFKVNYTLKGSITNNTDTQLNYKVYKVTGDLATDAKIVDGCTLRQYQDPANAAETRFTYMKEIAEGESEAKSSCIVNTTITGGTVIGSGTVDAKTGDTATPKEISIASTDANNMALTSTTSGASVNYYLVVEYPDTGNPQTANGSSIVATLSEVAEASSTQVTP